MFVRKTTFSPRIDFNSNILDQQGVARSQRWFPVPGPDDEILVCFLIKNPPGSRRKYRHLVWQLVSRRDARSLLVIAMQNARSILPSRGRTEGTASINKYLARKWLRTDRRTLSRRERGWFLIGEGKKQTPDWMIAFFLPSFFFIWRPGQSILEILSLFPRSSFFFFYNEKTDFVGIMETVKGDIGYFARALQIHFCGNGLHGKDFFHRFYSSFIEFFFGNMRYFHDKVYYSLFWCNFIFHSSNWISAKVRRCFVLSLYENLTFFNRTFFINKFFIITIAKDSNTYARRYNLYYVLLYTLSLYNLY